ncbi:MAG: hypothetical protein JWR24_475 [Actinoallomurus sp.]|jgi:hypothetical protein|nr:hypothetical protein [Actinoallomurus sp.]
MREVQQRLFELHIADEVRLLIAARFPLEHAADALELVRRGGLLGKVILELGAGG